MSLTPDLEAGPPTRSAAVTPAAVVLHGHFYQPPREDPWTGRVRDEPTAAPFDNWNERITHECYAPLASSGAFEWLSFDVGPTLARWLEREYGDVHDAIVEGDRASRARLGFGNAIAQPYHHIILPLASAKERRTEIRWGLRDFERRFGRRSEGLWLPETAVDTDTLASLADEGVSFTILAPHQVAEPPRGGVGRISLGDGRQLAVFIYDGHLSHDVAFGALLEGEDAWYEALRASAREGIPLISLAADGETFGHHHAGADETLRRVLDRIHASSDAEVVNFAAWLARARDIPELILEEESSWSCAHGIDRWRADCGCKMAPERASHQRWRAPLRAALEELAAGLDGAYASLAPAWLRDPDRALENLETVLGSEPGALESYARDAALSSGEEPAALLEMMRDRAAMFTSCAWFFDDIAGLEANQILGYAAHALSRLEAVAPEPAAELEAAFVGALAEAPSNDPELADGAGVFRRAREARRARQTHPRNARDAETR